MKLFGLLLLVGLATAGPISKDDKLVVTKEFFPDELAVYTSEHDIVNIFVPLNALNFNEDDEDDDTGEESGTTLFFVEGDAQNGPVENKGLYILKNGKAKKLLENGRDATASQDESRDAYFATNEGIYSYNSETNSADKYGSVTDSIINIVKDNDTDTFYILTEDKQVYKVTDDGNKKVKIDDVPSAEQIMLDFANNLYYYGADKVAHVVNADGVKTISGLPENPTSVKLLRPPFLIEGGVPFIVDNAVYIIFANGSSEPTSVELQAKPTAYSMEATLIQYYGYNKKIYEYNILAIILGSMLEELKEFLNEQKDTIESIATRSRSDLHPQLLF